MIVCIEQKLNQKSHAWIVSDWEGNDASQIYKVNQLEKAQILRPQRRKIIAFYLNEEHGPTKPAKLLMLNNVFLLIRPPLHYPSSLAAFKPVE